MKRILAALPALLLLLSSPAAADDASVLDSMDRIRFRAGKQGTLTLVDGKVGKAIAFQFPDKCQNVFFSHVLHGQPAWDSAAGFSFWVKGDGSTHFGGLQFIYNNDFALRYDYMFPIKSTAWTKIAVAWDDLIPTLPGEKSMPLNAGGPNRPSKLTGLFVGKWWYWRDYAAHSFTLDDLRLEKTIPRAANDFQPAGAPLARTLAKLRAGKPVTIITMGDSLTDTAHWSNRKTNWPALLKTRLESHYKSTVRIVNPAIGGAQLRQGLILMPRWLAEAPEPDLVTVCFGANDWDSGMRGPQFLASNIDGIRRIRRATNGKADILMLTTVPGLMQWNTRTELADACRKAAKDCNAGLADVEKAFQDVPKTDRAALFVSDKVHLGPAGQEATARAVLQAIERQP